MNNNVLTICPNTAKERNETQESTTTDPTTTSESVESTMATHTSPGMFEKVYTFDLDPKKVHVVSDIIKKMLQNSTNHTTTPVTPTAETTVPFTTTHRTTTVEPIEHTTLPYIVAFNASTIDPFPSGTDASQANYILEEILAGIRSK